jgi:fucose permease
MLTASILIALAGFTLAWLSTNTWVIVLALFVVGLGLSIQWPIGVSRAVASSGGLIDKASGLSSVAAGASGGVAPFVLGALSDSIGVHAAFLIVPVMLATALVLVIAKPVKSRDPIVG